MPTTGWLRERWTVLLPALATLGQAQEAEIQRLCEQEIAFWRDERHLQPNSLRNPITDTRNEIRKALAVTPENGWTNAEGVWEHLALKYMNLPQEVWVQMNEESSAVLEERLRSQQLLTDVEAIVRQAALLLQSRVWHEIAVGLAVCTGRRLAEVMKTATFTQKTAYTVLFTGQVKGRGREEAPFEIPTLVRASLVLDALDRLRRQVPTDTLEVKQINAQFGQAVRETAARAFAMLVPTRTTREELYTHLFRAVYARIAVYWYCPPTVADITYMATIQGHRFILEPEVEPGRDVAQTRLNYASNAHYFDYKIGDGQGNLDGRQGIKLGQPEVVVLEIFKQKEEQPMPIAQEVPTTVAVQKKKKSSLLRVTKPTRDRFVALLDQFKQEGQMLNQDELVQKLLDSFEAVGTTATPVPMGLSLDTLGLSPKGKEVIREAMEVTGETDVRQYLIGVAEKEAQQQVAQAKRRASQDLEQMTTSALTKVKDVAASQERMRRALYCLMKYNRTQATNPLNQWYINVPAVQNLVGGRKEIIKQYLEARSTDIDQHHRELHIEPRYNHKVVPIKEMVSVDEAAAAYPWVSKTAKKSEEQAHA